MDRICLLEVPVETEVDLQMAYCKQTRCVVIQLAMNSVCPINLMAVPLTRRCSVLERLLCFGKFLADCGLSAF